MHTLVLHKKAEELRTLGYSYSYISEHLGVSKSTVSIWLKGIPFFPNEYTKEVVSNAQKKSVHVKRADKAFSLHSAYKYAENAAGILSDRDIFMLGLGIYIGEGSKSQSIVRIVNSDPRIIRFSMVWLKESFGLVDENFRVRIHCYPDTDQLEALRYWVKELHLTRHHFHDFSVDTRSNKKAKNHRVLPYGTAHLSVVSNGDKDLGVLLHRKILATIDRVLNTRD